MAEEKKVRGADQAVEDSMNTRQALKAHEAGCGAKGNLSQLVDKVTALDVVTLNEKVSVGSLIVHGFIDVFMVVGFFGIYLCTPLYIYLLHDTQDIECRYGFWECKYTAISHRSTTD